LYVDVYDQEGSLFTTTLEPVVLTSSVTETYFLNAYTYFDSYASDIYTFNYPNLYNVDPDFIIESLT
jgi:hypothetical protein